MPSKFAKVQKHVSKKKNGNTTALHENSRDALRLRKAVARDDRVARMSAVREKANEPHMLRIIFFQDLIPSPPQPLTDSDLHEVVKQYVTRNDDQLAAIKAERRPGRPASTKQTLLEQQIHQEQKEYETGLWIPDMRTAENLKRLGEWKGHWVSLSQLSFVRLNKDGVITDSAWPPKGAA